MELHHRFMNASTGGVTLLLDSMACNRDFSLEITNLIFAYNENIRKGYTDVKMLEAFRMLLCYEYKLLIDSRSNESEAVRDACGLISESLGTFNIDIKNFLHGQCRSKEELALLYEILVLQMILGGDPYRFAKQFDGFHETHKESLATSDKIQNLYMRVSECFADSYNLYYYLFKKRWCDEAELNERCVLIQTMIKVWLKRDENVQWKSLAPLLPKLAIVFGSDKIVSPLWNRVSGKSDDLGNTLAALCVTADVCFPCKKETPPEIQHGPCMQKQFWSILPQGLTSGVSQHRKQALYLMKRAVDFMECHESAIRKKLETSKESIVPFVCSRLPIADSSIEQTKKSFFLILEALEEKQKHLVLPALSHLRNLVKACADHKPCRDGFNVIWLHCVLQRILQHDNDAITMFGMEVILEADLDIFDESFLNFVVKVLNNTFLYEYDWHDDEQPRIVKLLTLFFERSETAGISLINSFIRAISRVSWSPVPLYWILNALQMVDIQQPIVHNVWTSEEIKCIGVLVEKILTMNSVQLRRYSHFLILTAFPKYTRSPLNPMNFELTIDTQSLCLTSVERRPSMLNWSLVIEHLANVIEPSEAALYVTRTCDTFFTIERHVESWARGIALVLYSMRSYRNDMELAENALRHLFQNLIDADLRPYAYPASIFKVLDLVSHLMNFAFEYEYETMKAIQHLVSPYSLAIIKILSRSLERKTIARSDEYLLAIKALINVNTPDEVHRRNPWWPETEKELERFEDKCIYIIANPEEFSKTQWCYATKVLCLCREHTFYRRPNLAKTYIPPLLKYFKNEIPDNGQNDRFTPDCLETIAKLVHQAITKSPSDICWPSNLHWYEELRILIETGSDEVIEPVAASLYELLEKSSSLAIDDLVIINLIIRESWRNVFQLKRTRVFLSAVTQLTRLIVNSTFLQLNGAKEYAVQCATEMTKEGERVPALKRIFLTSVESLCPQDVLHFRKSFMSCLLHGAVPRRDQRIERGAIMHSDRYCVGDCYTSLNWSIDNTVRAQSVVVLLRALTSPQATEVGKNVLMDLLDVLEQNKNKRYFDNSHLHRLKHRVMQTLLILEPFLNNTETQTLHDAMCDLLIAESNQPSVRLMQEWILIRIYVNNTAMRDAIWTVFATAVAKRPGSVVSLAGIVFHVSQLLVEDTQRNYVATAIPHLLRTCMGQQFNVRLYSQEILVKLFELLPADSSESNEYRQIYEAVMESRRRYLKKSSIRVLDNFYFAHFDPLKSYSIQTIYHTLPRLTNVCNTEWIDTIFWKWGFDQIECILPKRDNTRLNLAEAMLKTTKGMVELAEDPSSDQVLIDIQKKIIPWKSMVPFYDELSETSKATLSRRKARNQEAGIIVVASLIDRPPNLGGLARTCEIFGAKELVIGSLRYAEDREFQTLSVSAEKWITITEVKPYLLQKYLLEKQCEGWQLVGAEQTANSSDLLETEFYKKTVLLLGNEKDGIPANLIPLLDKCVEIPQNGVVRSLNVHVTGAICIWQYAKQHIFT